MSKNILITGSLDASAKKSLEAAGFSLDIYGPRDLLDEERLIHALHNKQAYMLGGDERASSRVIEATNELRIIAFIGAGYQNFIDVSSATQKGIAVTNTPAANKQAVAEMAIALMLAAWRQIPYLDSTTKTGEWKSDTWHDIRGKTIGIIGMGAIGQRVAEIAHNGFDMQVIYFSRTKKPAVENQLGARMVPLPELLRLSDVVSLHCPYDPKDPTTEKLIGSEQLVLMKQSAILINTARAQVVDGAALCEALSKRQIAAAAFDGYYTEPNPVSVENDPIGLLRLPNSQFIITPHVAWRTVESDLNMCLMAANSVIDILNGRSNPCVVNPDYKK